MTETLSQALDRARVLVCAGTGGVGKTTISAALALCGARRGRRVLVLTIDPARRLADALGLAGLSDTPVEIDRESWDPSKEAPSSGAHFAMMLDPKPTFDRLVTRLSHDPQARARILENRMYRQLSEALAGSAEYAAMERVLEAVESSDYDLVVVDTPPSSHALDFLSTPRRLRRFLEGRFVAALLRPAMSAGRFGARIFGDSLQRMLGLIERIGGVGFLDDLSEFMSAVSGIADGFLERALAVEQLLLGPETRFLLVGGTHSGTESGALEFLDALGDLGVGVDAIILNRLPAWPLEGSAREWMERLDEAALARDLERLREALVSVVGTEQATPLAEAAVLQAREAALGRAEAERSEERLLAHAPGAGTRCFLVNERPGRADALAGLMEIGGELLVEATDPAR
jgi:anion-transporting  ArsA/GET3 family ATPase